LISLFTYSIFSIMNLTPRQQAEASYAERPAQERFNQLHHDIAYLETLNVEQAPVLTFRAEPDSSSDEGLELTITGAEFLADLKELVIARLRKMSQDAATAIRQAGIPKGCTTSQLEVGNGISVTIVHGGPPIAHSEAEVVLD
jgi:hypothetical protein